MELSSRRALSLPVEATHHDKKRTWIRRTNQIYSLATHEPGPKKNDNGPGMIAIYTEQSKLGGDILNNCRAP